MHRWWRGTENVIGSEGVRDTEGVRCTEGLGGAESGRDTDFSLSLSMS